MKHIRIETGICHLRVEANGRLVTFLEQTDLSPLQTPKAIPYWLEHGCVYVNGVRQRADLELQAGEVVRLHTRPKKYTRNFSRLSDHIISNETDFLVLNKPAGLPTHATLDNFKDNAKFILEEELGHPIFTTHRLDIPTQGLLIMAKTAASQARINKLFARRQVTKIYRALSTKAVPVDTYVHYMDPKGHVPRTVAPDAREGWWRCEMRLRSVDETSIGFVNEIELLTGRTHQIRAQMAFLGAPLLGDVTYGSTWDFGGAIALESYRMELLGRSFQVPAGSGWLARFERP